VQSVGPVSPERRDDGAAQESQQFRVGLGNTIVVVSSILLWRPWAGKAAM